MIPPEPTIEIGLHFSCGCIEVTGRVANLNGMEPILTSTLPCPPECKMCAEKGPCPTRAAMPPAYPEPTDFQEIKPQRRHRYQRMELSA